MLIGVSVTAAHSIGLLWPVPAGRPRNPPGRCVHLTATTHQEKFLTPGQSRAARKLLGWSQTRLAKAAGLGLSTVYDLECQRRDVSAASVEKMRKALEAAGVEFTNGKQPGVRLRE